MDIEAITENLRKKLIDFPLYESNHWVQVFIKDNIYISYAQTLRRIENLESTRFDVQINRGNENICYILDFYVEKNKRNVGYGSLLYRLIEYFCISEFKCKRFVTTPSGEGAIRDSSEKCFWEKMGFKYVNSVEAEKRL